MHISGSAGFRRLAVNTSTLFPPSQDAQLDVLKESIDREILSGGGVGASSSANSSANSSASSSNSLLGAFATAVRSVCHSPVLMQVWGV